MAKDRSHLTPVVRADKNNVTRTVYVKPVPNSVDKLRMVPPVSMSDPIYEHLSGDYEDDEGDAGNDTWLVYGFDDREAEDWIIYGFESPHEAANWRSYVRDPDLAADLKYNGVPIGWASRWMKVRDACAGLFTFEDLVTLTGTDPVIAESYAKHFEHTEWGFAAAAGVNEKTAATVSHLVQGISLRWESDADHDFGAAFKTASTWASATAKPDVKRMQIIDSCLSRGIPLRKASNILGDTGDTDIYPDNVVSEVVVDRALRADEWVESAKYKKEPEMVAAYRALFSSLQSDQETTEKMVAEHGVKKVAESLTSGFTAVQAQHHLEHGGVAEISKGVL